MKISSDLAVGIVVSLVAPLLLLACASPAATATSVPVTATPPPSATPLPAPTAVPTPSATVTSEDKLRQAVHRTPLLGKIDRLQVFPSAGQPGLWIVDIHEQIADNLTDSMVANGALMDFAAISKSVYQAGVPLQWVAWTGSFSMQDQYGRTRVEDVLVLKLPADRGNTIAWQNLDGHGVYDLADHIVVAPAFAQALR